MRTVTYKSVFDGVVRLHGRDPKKSVPPDMRDTIVERINDRVRTICNVWRWTFWELTEERAYRQVWNPDHQYLRASVIDGQPDEVFYIPTLLYYRANVDAPADPAIGVAPNTATDSWTVIDPVDTFISYDQTCRRSLGMVLGIYSRNPRVPTGSSCGGLTFMPSERGVDIIRPGNPTVFVHYKMPVPQYTMVPYVVGKNYVRTDLVFDPTTGEVFQALAPTTALPSDTFFWRRVPFPEEWESFVKQGAFADSLMEFDQSGNGEIQAKMVLSQSADQRANDALQEEIDFLTMQGQKLQWNFVYRSTSCCETLPWTGGTVTTLTEACDDELGWVYPTPTTVPQVAWQYRNDVVSFYTDTPNVVEIPTRNLLTGSIIQWVQGDQGSRIRQTVELRPGAANSLDPGQRNPDDYDATTNNKHWELIG